MTKEVTARWPKEAKAALCLTGDIDYSEDLSNGRLERIFEVLDDFKVKYTFPITSQVFLRNFDKIRQIMKHGDEIAGHGDIHETFKGQTYEKQRARLKRMMEQIREISGLRIKGFRAPYIEGDQITIKAASDLGLLYDSSPGIGEPLSLQIVGKEVLRIRDGKIRNFLYECVQGRPPKVIWLLEVFSRFQPFVTPLYSLCEKEIVLGYDLPYNPEVNGKKLDILTIPVSAMDDYSLIERGPRYKNWHKITAAWKKNFDDHYFNNSLYVLLAHPLRIGRTEYINALRSFVEYAINKNDVWFTTLAELAEWWNKNSVNVNKSDNEGV
jgi:peptidoglycan/xylan/chitin deacetylase (PgdA/CDA1 family)